MIGFGQILKGHWLQVQIMIYDVYETVREFVLRVMLNKREQMINILIFRKVF